jgi:hypothetical protein
MRLNLKHKSAALAIAALAVLGAPQSSYAAPFTSTGFPVADGTSAFSGQGSCSTAGTVNFSLRDSNGTSTSLTSTGSGTFNNTAGTYDFNVGSISIPSTYATGPTTLVATCPNGEQFTTPITVLASNRDLLNFGTTERTINGPVTVSGFCTGSNNNGVVTFNLSNATNSSIVSGASATASGSNGGFSSVVILPDLNTDLATLTATCPNGDVASILTVLGNTGNGVGLDVGGNPTDQGTGGTDTEGTGGTGVVPVGGVDAGSGSEPNDIPVNAALITALFAATLYGVQRFSRKNV